MKRTFKYKAFLSYSHADDRWATWLHRGLERYRVPKHIVAAENLPSNRLAPIFRDRDELGSASSLTREIDEALAASECLIVICSPASAASKWVNAEVERYVSLGRADRILCLIVDGEPPTCFPDALREAEPLAADARVHADGRSEAKLKIVAGMLGIGLGQLRQREVQRKQRRLLAVSAASLFAALLMAGLTLFAIGARQTAEREAATSAQVIEFLVDLFRISDPNQSLGETITAREILQSGAARVEAELADQPIVQGTLMTTMGQVYSNLGLYGDARRVLEKAIDLRQHALGPEHADLAETLYSIGEVDRLTAQYNEAERSYRRAAAILEGQGTHDEMVALGGVGLVLQAKGEYDEAESLFRTVLKLRRARQDESPGAVGNGLNNLASLLQDKGELDEAEQLYLEAIAAGREHFGDRHPDLAAYINNLASLYMRKSDYVRAEGMFRESLDMRRQLYGDSDPRIGRALNNLGLSISYQDRFDEAEAIYDEALAIRRQTLGDAHPDVAQTLMNIAVVLRLTNRYAEAEDAYRECLSIYVPVIGDDHPTVGMLRARLVFLMNRRGAYDEAEAMARQAIERFNSEMADGHPWYQLAHAGLGEALGNSGRYEEAEPILVGSVEKLRSLVGDSSGATRLAVQRLVEFYDAMGNAEKAAKYRSLAD